MRIKFAPRDIWVGLYWKRTYKLQGTLTQGKYTQFYNTFYLCIIPMFLIIFSIKTTRGYIAQYDSQP